VKKGDMICEWDPFNAVIISEFGGKVAFEQIEEGITYKIESDEQTGFQEKIIIDSRDRTKIPVIKVMSGKEALKGYNIPVGAHITVEEGARIEPGEILVKIPRQLGRTGDITGGLPRVTELFEARNPSNPAVVAEIDGIVSYGGIKRGNREIIVTSRDGEAKKYLVPLSKHILVQDGDFTRAGTPLSDGAITPNDILSIKGPTAVQEYLVNEVQEVYRLQGVKINDKHFEVIVRQMMRKVIIDDAGDTSFLEKQSVNKIDFFEENDQIIDKKVVTDPGDSPNLKAGQILTLRRLRDENSQLKRKDMRLVEARDAIPATSSTLLQGITQSSLHTKSWISAASFQETTKVLNEAAIRGSIDYLRGLKENVIVGHLIPAGTGLRDYDKMIVGSQEEYDLLMASKQETQEA
jgi:DNA-directed RNA polymerase subunit beta'